MGEPASTGTPETTAPGAADTAGFEGRSGSIGPAESAESCCVLLTFGSTFRDTTVCTDLVGLADFVAFVAFASALAAGFAAVFAPLVGLVAFFPFPVSGAGNGEPVWLSAP